MRYLVYCGHSLGVSKLFSANKYCILNLDVRNEHLEIKLSCSTGDLVSCFSFKWPRYFFLVEGMGRPVLPLTMEFVFCLNLQVRGNHVKG